MSLSNVRRSGFRVYRVPVGGPKVRRLLVRSGLVVVLFGAVLSSEACAGFITVPTYDAGVAPTSAVVADFNADRKLDLAVASDASGTQPAVNVLLGNGDGTFEDAQSYAAGANPRSMAVGDFNHDGILDLAVAGGAGVSVLLGTG